MTRTITRRAAIAGLSAIGVAPACAQSAKPEGTITIVHGFTPGGNVDLTARLVAERLAAKLGQQVVVEPKPGAGGSTAAAQVARAAPDGTTLFLVAGGHAVSAAIYNKLPFRSLEDFSWISMLSDFPFVFVTYPDHPAKNLVEFIAMAKADAGKILCATPGNGTGQHLALELFAATAGIKIQHVPYRGSPQAATDLLGRRVDAFMDNMTVVGEMVKDGRARALGITGPSRFFVLPDVPTFAEAGVPGFEWRTWASFVVPLGTPKPIVERLNTELVKAVNAPEVREKLIAQGLEPIGSSPATVTKWTGEGLARMKDIVQRAKIQAE
jgi:tripartite-type tricarboxylate transporter receptor subunit TctC